MTGDRFIQLGLWSQLVLLFLLDWGSLKAFLEHGAPWYHWVGFVLMNVVLMTAFVLMLRWMKTRQAGQASDWAL